MTFLRSAIILGALTPVFSANTIYPLNTLFVFGNNLAAQEVEKEPPRGVGPLLRTFPSGWVDRWDQLTVDSSLPAMVMLGCVSVIVLVLIPALLLLAGSSVIGVSDPTYTRALLCIVLLAAFTLAFIWGANAAGWLNTLILYEEEPAHLGVVLPVYLIGQLYTYKWCYVSTWGKALGLLLMGLLVTLIASAGFLVLLTILAS
ncbi:MAG: hypothetical protein O6952_03105 [Planctomycetota bacterium]|nr:hypothetical protein [Planctomycetota bacterium]